MIRRIILILVFFCFTQLHAQKQNIEKGDVHFDLFQFRQAIGYYLEALNMHNSKYEAYLYEKLAQCYMYSFEYKNAEMYFSKLVRLGDGKASPDSYLDYGNILKLNGDYEHALDQYKYYLTIFPDDGYAQFLIKSVQWAIKNKDAEPRNYTVVKTNLDMSGQSVGYCRFENGMIFGNGKRKVGANQVILFDLDFAEMKDSVTFVKGDGYLDNLRFELNESSPTVTADGQYLYFSANATRIRKAADADTTKKIGRLEKSKGGVDNIKIYVAQFINGRFQNPQDLPFNNKEYSCTHPCISADGNTLYFTSDMPNGFGGFDLYQVSRMPDGKWGKPANLGAKVNSAENELYPFVVNNSLYYSSKGHLGFGGYDLFHAEAIKGVWQSPKNLGKPFNSHSDDVAFICDADENKGYFSSNRASENGFDELYYFFDNQILTKQKPVLVASNLPAKTELKNQPPNKETLANLAAAPQKKPKFVNKLSDEELLKTIFNKMSFSFNEYQITSDSRITLDSAYHILQKTKSIKLQITAHTDSRGSAAYNIHLSEWRAQAAKKYLISRGISANRIKVIAKGETELLNNCDDSNPCSDSEHAVNRRVELKLVR